MSQVAFTVFSHMQFLRKFSKLANEMYLRNNSLQKARKVLFIGNGDVISLMEQSFKQMGLHMDGYSVKRKNYSVDVYTPS